MRFKAGIVAAALAGATVFVYAGPASAQGDGPNCSDLGTQVDIPNSIFPDDLDPTDLDSNDDGLGCEAEAGPPKAYDFTQSPPVVIEPEPEPEPQPQPQPQPEPQPEAKPETKPAALTAAPAKPVRANPTFTG